MYYSRMLGRSWCKEEYFDSILLSKEVISYATWFGNSKILLDNENKVKSGNTKGKIAHQSQLGTLHAPNPAQKYFKQDSVNAQHEEKVVGFNKELQKREYFPLQEKMAKKSPPMRYLNTETFKNALQNINHAFIMLYEPWRNKDQVVSFNKDLQKEQQLPPQSEPPKKLPPMRHVNAETFKNPLQKINHAFVMLYEPWRSKTPKSELLKTVYLFADHLLVTCGAVKQQLIARYDKSGFLAENVRYFDRLDSSSVKREAEFASFIHSQTTAYQVAKNALEAGFGASVILAFDSDFEDIIADAKPTFVMFYASFCGHCVTAKPAYSKLATTLKSDGKVKAIAIDAADNPKVADIAGIETLPTFKMYKAGKLVEDYTGERSYDAFLNFCKKYG